MMIRMKAKVAFSRVLDGQQYHGDPAHPDHDNGRRFYVVSEAHADALEAEGVAERIVMREVEVDARDRPGEGEDQELMGTAVVTSAGAMKEASAGIFPNGERTPDTGEGKPPIPAGGTESAAADNHPADHTITRGGQAPGTPDPDQAPTAPEPSPTRARRRPAPAAEPKPKPRRRSKARKTSAPAAAPAKATGDEAPKA